MEYGSVLPLVSRQPLPWESQSTDVSAPRQQPDQPEIWTVHTHRFESNCRSTFDPRSWQASHFYFFIWSMRITKDIFVDTKYKSNVKRCLLHFSSKVLDIKVADNSFEHFSNSYTWTVQCNSIYYMIIQFWCHTNAQPLVNLKWQSLWHKTLSEQQNNLSKTT